MYTQTPTGKAPKGTVQIITSNSRLQLRFRHAGKRYYLSLGLPDTKVNRKAAEAKKNQIELDIASGNFDPTLAKYKFQPALTTAEQDIAPKATPTLKQIWESYLDYKTPHASPKTLNSTYYPVSAHIGKCPTDGLQDALKFRRELLQATTESQARRTLMQLSAACKWGMQHRLIDFNPLEGLYKTLKPTQPDPPMSFSVEERDAIISAFENDTRSGINYRHYAPFIKFLFWTGCRPSEAIGLRWSSVLPDCSRIHFHESVVEVSGRLARRLETKTGVKRWFNCQGTRLQVLLQSMRPENPDPDALVFPSPKGGVIRESNFKERAWDKVLGHLGLMTKNGVKMAPYNCRDTFITLQATQGHSSTKIARWVGNSSKVIEEKYLDKLKLEHLRPTDI
jgi:integrase